MKKQIFVLLALGLTVSFAAAADDLPLPSNCTAPTWVTPPQMVHDQFVGHMTSTCHIKGEAGKGIALLDSYMKKATVEGNTVNSGPESAESEGMPATAYNVTFSSGQATVTSDETIASDGRSKIVFISNSTQTSGTGFADLLRRLDVRVDVSTTSDPTEYEVKLTTLTVIQRFFLCPTDSIFLQTAEGPAQTQFIDQLAGIVNEYTSALSGR